MKEYKITLTGKTPLLMHNDSIDWADHLDAWKNDPDNKKLSKAGDDRTPVWRWLGYLYHDEKIIGIPQANIMRSIMDGGVMVPVPGGRGGKTFKAQTQSGMMSIDLFWPLTTVQGIQIDWSDIEMLKDHNNFSDMKRAVEALGFDLFVKRVKNPGQKAKHIRVRPIFDEGWQVTGTVAVWDEQLTQQTLAQILEYAGQYKGLGDWRPGAPQSPGPYGIYTAIVE